MPDILSKKYTITNPQEQASEIDDMFDDLYRQLTDGIRVSLDEGDIVVGNEDGEFDALPLGTNGAFLRSGSVSPEWSTLIIPNAAAVGDILYGSAANVLSRLADVATGNVLLSGGVGVAPSWGKVDLAAHITGTLAVANGGTGRASHTAYAVICGGTTGTGAQQSIAGVGTSGQVLTSNGASALPTFQTVSGGTPTMQTTTLTGTQNDFSLSAAFTYLRCNNAAQVDFTGFSIGGNSPNEGDRCFVIAINATVTLAHQNVGSNFLFRFITSTAATLTLTSGQWAEMVWDGTTARWRVTNVGGSSGTNALLDGSVHSDTLAGTVVRGDIIIGNSTPKWARLAKPASAGVLQHDATDVSWGRTPSLDGIIFPGTQVASANANTLDDYEEGSWTPTIGGSGGQSGQVYSVQIGRYIKMGRLVVVTGFVGLSTVGTITTNAEIKGLPFTASNADANLYGAGSFSYFTGLATNWSSLGLQWRNNEAILRFVGIPGTQGTAVTFLAQADFGVCSFIFTTCYLSID